jgi:hypothetical protein
MVRGFDIDRTEPAGASAAERSRVPAPEAVAPELRRVLDTARGRVLETQHYRIDPAQRDEFLSVMAEVRNVRGRAGALFWQLYEDVAHADCWLEIWAVDSWHDHLRESTRISEAERGVLARALAFHQDPPMPPSRFIAIAPHRLPDAQPPPDTA